VLVVFRVLLAGLSCVVFVGSCLPTCRWVQFASHSDTCSLLASAFLSPESSYIGLLVFLFLRSGSVSVCYSLMVLRAKPAAYVLLSLLPRCGYLAHRLTVGSRYHPVDCWLRSSPLGLGCYSVDIYVMLPLGLRLLLCRSPCFCFPTTPCLCSFSCFFLRVWYYVLLFLRVYAFGPLATVALPAATSSCLPVLDVHVFLPLFPVLRFASSPSLTFLFLLRSMHVWY